MSTWTPTQLEWDFRYLRNRTYGPDRLLSRLEGAKFETFDMLKDIKISEDAFCLKYVLFAIQQCHLRCFDEDCLLAALGLLIGYESKNLGERRIEYCKNVGLYVQKIDAYKTYDEYWSDIDGSLGDKEDRLIRKVAANLQRKMDENEGKLGYIENPETVLAITRLSCPVPHYLQEEGYRKCEVDGRVFYIALTEAEKLRTAFSNPDKDEPFQENPGGDVSTLEDPEPDDPELEPDDPEPEPDDPGLEPDDPEPKNRQNHAKMPYIIPCVCILLVVFGAMIFRLSDVLANPDNSDYDMGPEQSSYPVNLSERQRLITDEEMTEIINNTKASIAAYDEAGNYDADTIRALVYERIANNPIFGDMVARALIEDEDNAVQGSNPWIFKFIEQTNASIRNPEPYREGMRTWLSKSYNVISPREEYKEFGTYLCNVLDHFETEGVYNLNATGKWCIASDAYGIYTRAIKDSGKSTQQALVLTCWGANGSIIQLIGFSIEDGSVVTCDPWEWGIDSFIE